MFGGGGGGRAPAPVQAPPPSAETDPAVQKKKGQRVIQARHTKGFLSTIQSEQGQQGLGNASIASGGTVPGGLQKLG